MLHLWAVLLQKGWHLLKKPKKFKCSHMSKNLKDSQSSKRKRQSAHFLSYSFFFFKQSSFQMLTTIPSKREAHQLVWFLLNVSFDRGPFFQYSPSVQIRNALLFVLWIFHINLSSTCKNQWGDMLAQVSITANAIFCPFSNQFS